MQEAIDHVRQMQDNYDAMRYGSSEEYGEALPWAMRELARAIAFMVAAAEFCTPAQMTTIYRRAEALLAAGRVIAKHEARARGPQTWGATDA